jgi:hypothetical protein
MRKSIQSILIATFVVVVIIACENNPLTHDPSISDGRLVSHSPCKSNKSSGYKSETPDTASCVEYTYDAATKKLALTHINAGFNCCPGELSCDVSLGGDTIIILEQEEAPMCDCNCLYDLEIEIDSVSEAGYQVKFIEPYAVDQDKLEFSIDLASEPDGSYCVTRTQYPWIEF